MNVLGNHIDNNALAAMARQAGPQVVNAIKTAAHRTGVNFAYLMEQAAAESSFDPKAGSKSSSAKGLYQFIEKTWLGMVRKYGAEHGLGKYAAMIDDNGKVSDPQARKEILELRNDPEKAALLAGEFASENRRYLEQYSGLKPEEIGSTELYFAHFLGAGGAAAFLKAYKDNPLVNAADLFPQAARANRNVFYDSKTGAVRTLAGVYDFFAKKFQMPAPAAAPAVAENTPAEPHTPPQPSVVPSLLQTLLARQEEASNPVFTFLTRLPLQENVSSGGQAFGGRPATQRPSFGMGIPVIDPARIMILAALDDKKLFS